MKKKTARIMNLAVGHRTIGATVTTVASGLGRMRIRPHARPGSGAAMMRVGHAEAG